MHSVLLTRKAGSPCSTYYDLVKCMICLITNVDVKMEIKANHEEHKIQLFRGARESHTQYHNSIALALNEKYLTAFSMLR